MRALAGVGVLVTRPRAQAGALSAALAAEGATVYLLPTLEFRALPGFAGRRAALGPVDRYDWIVFVSANAVEHGAALLEGADTPSIIAIGPATAAALKAHGHVAALSPDHGYSSEALLATPRMQEVAGERFLVVRGTGGREALAEGLTARGALVTHVDVYERLRATPEPGIVASVESALAAGAITAVTATSAEVLRCLVELLGPAGREGVRRIAVLAGGARLLEAARQMGFDGEGIVARSPDTGDLVAALLEWRAAR